MLLGLLSRGHFVTSVELDKVILLVFIFEFFCFVCLLLCSIRTLSDRAFVRKVQGHGENIEEYEVTSGEAS